MKMRQFFDQLDKLWSSKENHVLWIFRSADYTAHKNIYWLTNEWMNESVGRYACESVSQIKLVCTSLFFGWDKCAWFVLPFCANFFYGIAAQRVPWPHSWGFSVTHRHTTFRSTPLDKGSARRRNLCLKTHNNHIRQASMSPVGFEDAISADERP
jgi:hypothetical protein